MGHLLLHTTKESLSEQQPIRHDNLTITGACRIDNRADLLSRLNIPKPYQEVADADLILHAYRRWGESCVDHLLGDFAFALWDRERGVLFCARDPIGVEPFYFHLSPELFVCASEIRALLVLPHIPSRLDEEGVAAYLTPFIYDVEQTLVRGVRRLPAGHVLTVSHGQLRLRRYWKPDPEREVRLPSDGAYAEALREVMMEAVRCRLRSDRPVGTMLSGGLDSSTVTCLARAIRREGGGEHIPAVSVTYQNLEEEDECRWIDAVLAAGDLVPCSVPWSGDVLPDPEADICFFTSHLLVNRDAFRGAATSGIRVLLGGDGGDHALSWGHMAHVSLWSLLQERQWRYGARRQLRNVYRRLWHPWGLDSTHPLSQPLLLNRELAQRLDIRQRQFSFLSEARRRTPRGHHVLRVEIASATGMLDADVALAARHGLEIRSPFWDRRVLELCLALPLVQKEGKNRPREVLRRAMADLLPPEVQRRQGKWSGRSALLSALRRVRDAAPFPTGTEPPLSTLLDSAAVADCWSALDLPQVPTEASVQCWRLAALQTVVQAHRLGL